MSVRNAVRKATEKRPTGRPKFNVRSYYVGNGRLSESGVYVSDSARRLGGLRAGGSAVGDTLGLGFRALPGEQLDGAIERLRGTVAGLPVGSSAAAGYRQALVHAEAERDRRATTATGEPAPESSPNPMAVAKAMLTEAARAALRGDSDACDLAAQGLAAVAAARGKRRP